MTKLKYCDTAWWSEIVAEQERSPYLHTRPRPHTTSKAKSVCVLLQFRQEKISQNLLETSFKSLAVRILTVTQIIAFKLPQIYKLLEVLRPTLTLQNFFDGY